MPKDDTSVPRKLSYAPSNIDKALAILFSLVESFSLLIASIKVSKIFTLSEVLSGSLYQSLGLFHESQ